MSAPAWLTVPWAAGPPLIVQATLLAALVWVITLALRRAPARLRYALWLVVLVRLAVPVVVVSPVGVAVAGGFAAPAVGAVNAGGAAVAAAAPVAAGPAGAVRSPVQAAAAAVPLRGLLFRVWLAAVLLLGTGAVGLAWRARRRVRACEPVARSDVTALAEALSAELGLRRPPRVVACGDETLPAPAVLGVLRPTVVLPASAAGSWPAELLRPVLLHELLHIRRRDTLVGAFQVAVQVAWFFHPLVWVASRALRRERELLRDDEVVRLSAGDPGAYSRAMVAAAEAAGRPRRPAVAGLAMAETRSELGRRVRRLLDGRYRPEGRRRWAAAAAAVLLGLACVALSGQRPARAGEEPAKPEIMVTVFYERGFVGPERTPVELQGDYTPGRPHRHGHLAYPADVLAYGVSGLVAVRALVDRAGNSTDVRLERGLDPRLDALCLEDVRQTAFDPTVSTDGKPVEVEVLLRYRFVASPRPPAVPRGPSRGWEGPFAAAYAPAAGRSCRLVPPPFPPSRAEYFRWVSPMQAAAMPGEPARFLVRWAGGAPVRQPGASFGDVSLGGLLRTLGFAGYEIEAPAALLHMEVPGDLVVRRGTSREALVQDLERELRERAGLSLRLRLVEERREVIVARGRLDLHPDATPEGSTTVQIYHLKPDPGAGAGGGTGNVADFVRFLGASLGRRTACEAGEGSTKLSWRVSPDASRTEYVDEVLANVSAQTGLAFTREERAVQVLEVSGDRCQAQR